MEPLQRLQEEVQTASMHYRVGMYVSLLQLRFIVPSYGIAVPERDLEYILMKQVYYRLFQDSAGEIYEWCLEKLIQLLRTYPALLDPEHRNRLIEMYEIEERKYLTTAIPLYFKLEEVPAPWRNMILTTLDKIRRREYVVHDQTAAGSVAIWEGEFMKDVMNVQNLRLLEKYLLMSNIALFGYDVYLTFSAFALSDLARRYLETHNLMELYGIETTSENIVDVLYDASCKMIKNVKVRRENGAVVLERELPHGKLRLRIVKDPDIDYLKNCRDIVITISSPENVRKLRELPNVLAIEDTLAKDKLVTLALSYVKKILEI